jgi:hypothetical protein
MTSSRLTNKNPKPQKGNRQIKSKFKNLQSQKGGIPLGFGISISLEFLWILLFVFWNFNKPAGGIVYAG